MNYINIAKQKFEALRTKSDVLVLSVESSCDETAIAIVKNGRQVLANVVASQIEIHRRFGGVVPEVASRNHIACIYALTQEALSEAGLDKTDLDAIAVTYGAGLVGALMVGVNFAKALAFALQIPLIAVSHVEGHIAANYISHADLTPPFLCLMVSGGHTQIIDIQDYCKQTVLGSTVDDAAGEAFDKVARVLSLPYPGGPQIERLAQKGQNIYKFNVAKSLQKTLDFSFSGVKVGVINLVHNFQQRGEAFRAEDVARSFEECVTEELSQKAVTAALSLGHKTLVLAGGVGANKTLQQKLADKCQSHGITCYFPVMKYCTDNAAMIGSMGYYMIKSGVGLADLSLTANPFI